RFAARDATELAGLLTGQGFRAVLLTAEASVQDSALRPTRANIEDHLGRLLGQFRKGDTLIVAFAGHGLKFDGGQDAYFCPQDGKPFQDEAATLVSLGQVYRRLDRAFQGNKVLLVDACRNDPQSRGAARGLDG